MEINFKNDHKKCLSTRTAARVIVGVIAEAEAIAIVSDIVRATANAISGKRKMSVLR